MAGSKTQFDADVQKALLKTKGVYFPVKTGLLTRLLIMKAPCRSLYPNPEDEFCAPEIGPSWEIITSYEETFLNNIRSNVHYFHHIAPIVVERLHPDGYMIINGHHRWAAARRINQAKIPVQIVNLMHSADVKKILANSTHEKRAALDLDEVLLRGEDDPFLEKLLPFPWNRLYRERIRLGVPALFHQLEKSGYDIWLYSFQYHSADAIQDFFRRYHVHVDGVITAVEKRQAAGREDGESLEKLIQNKYRCTLHVDNESVLQIFRDTKEHREFPLSGAPDTWSQEIVDMLEKLESESGKAGKAI